MPPNKDEITLEDALGSAFNLDSMKRMLRRQLGIVLEDEIDLHRGKKFIVSELVELSIRDGWRDDLIRGALADNGGNPDLKKAARALNVLPPVPAAGSPTGSVPVTALNQGSLEKLARDRGVSIRFEEYASKLNAMAKCLCSIEVPTGKPFGTGWLVAPDLVLTNYHVVEDIDKNRVAVSAVTCRFDYFKKGSAGVECGLASSWLRGSSPYALADERAEAPEPTVEELDYALIKLARAMGDEDTEGGKRGYIAVQSAPPLVIAEDIVMVPQFPNDRSLELSFGKVIAYNNSGTRLRYDANTEPGASGSPVVTMALEPFGLHHAGGIGRSRLYNQCVPLRLALQHMITNRADQFWK